MGFQIDWVEVETKYNTAMEICSGVSDRKVLSDMMHAARSNYFSAVHVVLMVRNLSRQSAHLKYIEEVAKAVNQGELPPGEVRIQYLETQEYELFKFRLLGSAGI